MIRSVSIEDPRQSLIGRYWSESWVLGLGLGIADELQTEFPTSHPRFHQSVVDCSRLEQETLIPAYLSKF